MMPRLAIFRLSSRGPAIRSLPWLLLLAAVFSLSAEARGQDAAAPSLSPPAADTADDPISAVTMLDHPSTTPWWISGQMNFIGQGHGSFPAQYSGPNSLKNTPEFAVSQVLTLYTGYELTPDLEALVDIEVAAGHGISNALGIAGFTNLDVVRNPDLSKAPYLARAIVRYTIPLSDEEVEAGRSWIDLRTEVPARRIEIIAGKFSMPDFFDLNDVGTDSHLQFMNWCDDQNGAWDYAANTRGYTDGAIVQYVAPRWAVRFGSALMPKVANGIYLDADIARARGDNLEFELYPALFRHHPSAVRLLSYVNHANMGSYRDAIDQFREGLVSAPDITAVERQGRVKYGFGVNLEQDLPHGFRGFARWGWSDGHNESFAYTEVDRTGELGFDLRGNAWKRRSDKLGAAYIVNGLSGDHREYLALGGLGFLLGDGRLNYGTERIFETYYTAHLWRGFFGSVDAQHVTDPGYNRARGPLWVPSVRLHIDF